MTSIYILSTREEAEKDKYKVGKHTGTQSKLLSRYGTPLINPIIYYFREVNNAKVIEDIFKKRFKEHRIVNENDSTTEWVNLELNLIINAIDEIIKENPAEIKFDIQSTNKKINKCNLRIDKLIDSSDDNISIWDNRYLLYYNEQVICKFSIYYDDNNGNHVTELAIDTIEILSDYTDVGYIEIIIDKILDHIDTNYSTTVNYVINCNGLNLYISNDINKKLITSITDQILTYSNKYYYFFVGKDCYGIGPQYIIMHKIKNIKLKKTNKCDVLLSMENAINLHTGFTNDTLSYDGKIRTNYYYDPINDYKTKLTCKRNFSVVRKKMSSSTESDFKYTSIQVIFDKPIVFMEQKNGLNDIYFKFIVNGKDYTSETGKIGPFDYRINKIRLINDNDRDTIYSYGINLKLYSLSGFSYYHTHKDYLNAFYDKKSDRLEHKAHFDNASKEILFSQYYKMINNIYNDYNNC